jgi:hypothetical protein
MHNRFPLLKGKLGIRVIFTIISKPKWAHTRLVSKSVYPPEKQTLETSAVVRKVRN